MDKVLNDLNGQLPEEPTSRRSNCAIAFPPTFPLYPLPRPCEQGREGRSLLRGGFLQLPPAGPPIVGLPIAGLAPGEPTVPEDTPALFPAGEVPPLLFPRLPGLLTLLI